MVDHNDDDDLSDGTSENKFDIGDRYQEFNLINKILYDRRHWLDWDGLM